MALAVATVGCSHFRSPVTPLSTLALDTRSGGGCLAILLPGRWNRPESFRAAGFAEAVERRGLNLHLVAVDAHLGYYRNRSIVERLRLDVVAPARAAGYRSIWIVGTSLGGLGGLLYLRDHPEDLSGVLALAPFLGADDVLRELQSAGGPSRWAPPQTLPANDVGRELWSWLAPWVAGDQKPPLHLGWGSSDSLAEANETLATLLPSERVYSAHGGHDWSTWARLWERFLDRTAPCPGAS